MIKTKEKTYIRDGRAPIPKKESTSLVMSANKGKNTGPEVALRKLLSGAGIRGYRNNQNGIPGRPDISFPKKKIAIFINGCFWHGCKKCYVQPKTNKRFWKDKIENNQERDLRKITELKKLGWKTVVIWEHELKGDINKVLNKLKSLI